MSNPFFDLSTTELNTMMESWLLDSDGYDYNDCGCTMVQSALHDQHVAEYMYMTNFDTATHIPF